MKKTLIPLLGAGLGGAILVWAAVAIRGDAEAAPKAPRDSRAPSPAEAAPAPGNAPVSAPSGRRSAPPADTLDLSVVKARVEAMETRLRQLEARRDLLRTENEDLSREIAEKSADARARSTAEWRVRAWEKLLGLTETQKEQLKELWTGWAREDQSGPASRSAWLGREGDIRSRLSSEQSLRLHDQTAQQSARKWAYMGQTLGRVAGVPREEYGRLQQALGPLSVPDTALLPEAHGVDWKGMLNTAVDRVRPVVTPDQAGKIDQYAGRYN